MHKWDFTRTVLKVTKQGNHDKKSQQFNRHASFNLYNNSLISQYYLEGVFFQSYLRLLFSFCRKKDYLGLKYEH